MGVMLKDYGFLPFQKNFKDDNGRYHNRAVWQIKIASDPLLHEFLDPAMLAHAGMVNEEEPDATVVPHDGSQFISTEIH
jgi:hypothetical protein